MRWTIGECRSISINKLNKMHYLHGGPDGATCGECKYTSMDNGKESISVVKFEVCVLKDVEHVRLFNDTGLEQKITLVWKPCRFGGRRWWLVCPGMIEGQICDRRVAALYMPPYGKLFACRYCYGIAYESSYKKRPKAKFGIY